MKILLYLIFIPSLIEVSFAQNPMRFSTPISTPGGTMTTTSYVYIPTNGATQLPKFDYKIKLLNDSVVEKFTKIEVKDSIHYIKFKKNKKKYLIRPADTKEVRYTNLKGVSYVGIPTDTCWLFKIRSGKISTYAYFPDLEKENTIAIQKGTDPIVAFTKENVLNYVAGNEEAIKFAKKDKLYKAVVVYNGWVLY